MQCILTQMFRLRQLTGVIRHPLCVLLLINTSIFSCPALAQNGFVRDSLDIYIAREMARWQVPGLAISIVKDGKLLFCKGYGVRDIETKIPVDEFSLFQIASNSKAFTATAIALLDYQKTLSLDEKVTHYLPYFRLYEPSSTELCTVRDLLTHRIGLGTFQGDFLNWGSELSRKEIVEGLARTKPKNPFRYRYGYCNAGYITAGEIIPVVTNISWDEFVKIHFFDPLKMVHTNTNFQSMKIDKNACSPHIIHMGKLGKIPLVNIDNMGPSACINSCVSDMSKWLLMQLDSGRYEGNQVIPYKVLQETRKAQMANGDIHSNLFPSKHFSSYGLGWNSYDYQGKRIWEHSGGANGFVTKTEFIPEVNLGVIVYTNSESNSLYDALVKQVIDDYLDIPYRNLSELYYFRGLSKKLAEKKALDSLVGLAAEKRKTPIPLQNFSGKYSNTMYGEMTLSIEKGKLMMHLSHHPNNAATMDYLGDDKFLCSFSDLSCGIEVLPFTLENKKVKTIHVKVNDYIDYEWYEFTKYNEPNQN